MIEVLFLRGNQIPRYFTKIELEEAKENIKFFRYCIDILKDKNIFFIFLYDSEEKKVVGISHFGMYNEERPYWGINFLAVHTNYRNRGLSKVLIKETLDFFDDQGILELKLSMLTEEGKKYRLGESFLKESENHNVKVILDYNDR